MAFYNVESNFTNFQIGFSWEKPADFSIWAKGYKNAANSIVESILEKGNFPDYDAYPVVFCYRHGIELYMKGIIYDTILILEFENHNELICDLIKSHNLLKLYNNLKEILDKLYEEDKSLKAELDNIKIFLNEFDSIDNGSFSFRYPLNNNGKHNFNKTTLMNLDSIHVNCNSILDKFEIISNMIDGRRSVVNEMLSSFRFSKFDD
jgi:hypothetical protein